MLNGVLAPPLIVLVVLLTSKSENNGPSGQLAPAALFRMGDGGDYDRRSVSAMFVTVYKG